MKFLSYFYYCENIIIIAQNRDNSLFQLMGALWKIKIYLASYNLKAFLHLFVFLSYSFYSLLLLRTILLC